MSKARKVQERSVATRRALLDAAVDSLVELGYAGTTTLETARRAGVSRGAQLHHFRTRAELLTAAVEHLLIRRVSEFRAAMEGVDATTDRIDAAIDVLWSMCSGDAFVAWLELWVAARTDPELARAVIEMETRFGEETRATFLELFPPEEADDPTFQELGRDFTFALMDGLALVSLIPHGRRPATDHLNLLKELARQRFVDGGVKGGVA